MLTGPKPVVPYPVIKFWLRLKFKKGYSLPEKRRPLKQAG